MMCKLKLGLDCCSWRSLIGFLEEWGWYLKLFFRLKMLVECGRQELCSCVPFLITWHRVELISEEMVLLRVDMSILSKVGMKLMRWSLNVLHGLRKPFITRRRVQGLDMFLAKIEIVFRIRIFDLSIIFWYSWLTEVCFSFWLVSSFENWYQGHM